ncbi:Gfo/Idh/MocA family protein [Formosa sp. S-31]|uniref:Gfo/Idh/MocA family protein n=1 Tax=Formosa sp. S-31 TaxID=2790949 RepID=UPI003EBD686A
MKAQHDKVIKWGIIGLGRIAKKFAKDLLTIENAQLYAVASRSQDKADTFAKSFKAAKAYDSYEALAKDETIDAVYIATPHSLHKSNAILCLNHKKAVLCEKPFAMNAKEVYEMIDIAKTNKVLLMEALWTYFLPHYQYVLQLIKNKTFGNVLKVEADFGFTRPFDDTSRLFNKNLGGGSLLDIGIYPIFSALTTLGIPDDIEAQCTTFDNGADATCDMVFNYNSGSTAVLKSSLIEDTPTTCTIYCDTATIKLNTQFHAPTSVTIIKDGKDETIDFKGDKIGYYYETVHFNALLRAGKTESDIMSFDFSKTLIETLDKVRQKINLEY